MILARMNGLDGESQTNSTISEGMRDQILARLKIPHLPDPTLDGLQLVYGAWCQRVPFDNVRKLIEINSHNSGPLPGATPEDFFTAWLKFGTGGTCWSGAGALYALLKSLGFEVTRGIATMLAAPNLPPNHGTVRVQFAGKYYLVDTAMLHVDPILLDEKEPVHVRHPAWGLRCGTRDGRLHIAWRPLHKPDGFECRLERFGAAAEDYHSAYDRTRGWSPFNYEVTARKNVGDEVVGVAFGHAVKLRADGRVDRTPITRKERDRILVEEIGMSEEIVRQLPPDMPTPPPPGSRTAQAAGRA